MPYLNFVKENRFVFAAAVNSPGGMQSAGKYEGLYKHVFNPILERFHYPENERRYAINFYISGIVAVIKQWLEAECLEKTDEIAGVITKCIRPYIEAD
ncbi:TetR-like C-terminal domain-containing protein [Butyrivibrio sp. YAB3001]|uniref:TetR-like C-terminal domain-containing protein n=1 Tax=Butyrivibrio sp. YAB3001 TaxID=1520812 RepID=UPI0008F61A6F|nr:TetR-like C-terminal domain-containing protein [Butyrivibrio sp. YAB3001]SFC71116.1 Transcriptional regulator C-terminal region [Butyrivibrio sp. YAB3001]